ncbi:hypothetical protein K469DRAFT_694455 [Zopfia rhizophila CBS 207.26]|uniref:Uncharacterized protein n=1 Tax=Zopfia rhizophila CBS 207.26 TaxID=1314779 RepID=A0A6A6EMZ0_9PEZI|nr:hypothetical protein K469DRAFT_694455 [Zopfia rhizophila CBS 207.26]
MPLPLNLPSEAPQSEARHPNSHGPYSTLSPALLSLPLELTQSMCQPSLQPEHGRDQIRDRGPHPEYSTGNQQTFHDDLTSGPTNFNGQPHPLFIPTANQSRFGSMICRLYYKVNPFRGYSRLRKKPILQEDFHRTIQLVSDVNGHKQLHFGRALFDTGMPINIISRNVAASCGHIFSNDNARPVLKLLEGTFHSVGKVTLRWCCDTNERKNPRLFFDQKFLEAEFYVSKEDVLVDVIIGRETILTERLLEERLWFASPGVHKERPKVNTTEAQDEEKRQEEERRQNELAIQAYEVAKAAKATSGPNS